jgi:hypothetical protein
MADIKSTTGEKFAAEVRKRIQADIPSARVDVAVNRLDSSHRLIDVVVPRAVISYGLASDEMLAREEFPELLAQQVAGLMLRELQEGALQAYGLEPLIQQRAQQLAADMMRGAR